MTLDEAIDHAQRLTDAETECGREHGRLAAWLLELKKLKQEKEDQAVEAEPGDPWCDTCENTGFYGDNGPGIIGNKEYVPCGCGAMSRLHGRLAEAEHQAKRNRDHLQGIWDHCKFKYDWEYTGQIENFVKQYIDELRAHSTAILEQASDKIEAAIERNTPIDQLKRIELLEEWIKETAAEIRCTCDEAFTGRGLHANDCKEYLLKDCPVDID